MSTVQCRPMDDSLAGWAGIKEIRHGDLCLTQEDLKKLPRSQARTLQQLFEKHAIPMTNTFIAFTKERVEVSSQRVALGVTMKLADSEEIRERIEKACSYIQAIGKTARVEPEKEEYSTYVARLKKTIDAASARYLSSADETPEGEIASHLLINKPGKMFNEILECFFVAPEGSLAKGRHQIERMVFANGLLFSGFAFVVGYIILSSMTLLLGVAGAVLLTVSTAFASISIVHGLYRCFRLEREIDEFMNNENLSEEERMRGVLRLLCDKVCISQDEMDSIHDAIKTDMPNASDVEKSRVLKEKVLSLAKTKVGALKKIAGNKGARQVIKHVENLLNDLDKPEKAAQALRESQRLCKTVKSENTKRKKFYALMLFVSIVTFIIAVVSIALILASLSTGLGGIILLGISLSLNVFWVFVGLYFMCDMIKHRMNRNDLLAEG